MKSRLGMQDNGTNHFKYPSELRQVSDLTPNAQNFIIRWANESNVSFNTGVTLDTSLYNKATRMGRYRRRNYEIEYSGTDVIRIEALEGDVTVGNN